METDKYLAYLLRMVEVAFNHGKSSKWRNRDFEQLHIEILNKTKTSISTLTLMRLFGKIKTNSNYYPQKGTLNALEDYAGVEKTKNIAPEENDKKEIDKYTTNKRIILIIGSSIFLILLITSTFYLFKRNTQHYNFLKGKLTLVKIEGDSLKTAYFKYFTPNATDSFQILFDEGYPPLYIENGKYFISYFFQYPGMFLVRMIKNNLPISDTIPILVSTKGWKCTAYNYRQKYTESYYMIPFEKNDGVVHPTTNQLKDCGLDVNKEFLLRFDNFHPTGVNNDSFKFLTVFKNPDHQRGVRCNAVYLKVVGRKGCLSFRFSNPGCSHWNFYRLNEMMVYSDDEDMSQFAVDMTKWQKINIIDTNKRVDIYFNGIHKFSHSYKKSIGEIVGVSVIFHGTGYIQKCLLTDQHNNELFNL